MRQPRALIVEDEDAARELFAAGLRRLRWHVDTARDGREAIERLDAGWDAVVTDLLMPRCTGVELLGRMAALAPTAVRVVITSFGDKDRVVASLNAGADYLLEKPVTVEALDALLRRLLGRRDDGEIDRTFERRLCELSVTARERRLIVLVLKGLPNQGIADQLQLSEQTVRNSLSSLYRRLGVESRSGMFSLIFPMTPSPRNDH